MMRAILVPLDGSAFSECALPTACAMAERAQAALHLVLVHVPAYSSYIDGAAVLDDQIDAISREADYAYLQTVQQRLVAEGMPAPSIAVLDGPIAETLGTYATEASTDLIVMTTHGRGGMARFWLGSVADSFVRHSHVPVLLIHPREIPDAPTPIPPRPLRKICVALDGSSLAEQMLEPALALGALGDAEYMFVQVIDALVIVSSPFTPEVLQQEYLALHRRQSNAQQYLEALAAPLREQGYRITTQVLIDRQAALAILHTVREQGCDLIALATHGRGGFRRLLLGSVADKVLRGADRPVLLYRPRAELSDSSDAVADRAAVAIS
jgi:nucleotide-binding universal stress UspA family protein